VQNADFTEGDSFSNEVQVDLGMLSSLMLNRVGGEVDNTDVVTIDNCGVAKKTKIIRSAGEVCYR